jgi:hypothetical protein
MKDPRNTFGIPDTLPPLGLREVWNWLWLGFTGLLLLAFGFFILEALPSLIVSLTEWWRVSTVGLSLGLMVCGLGFPFAHGSTMGVLLGASVFAGAYYPLAFYIGRFADMKASPNAPRCGRSPKPEGLSWLGGLLG